MKNSLLYCLAATALTLSFCFERPSDASAPAPAPVAAGAEASLFPAELLDAPPPASGPEAAATAAARDSIIYHYYAQTLGLKLNYDENKDLLRTVTDWIGTPYRYGNNSRQGTDCSGFVTRVFEAVYGVRLKRSSRSMFTATKRVAKADMQTGDLVFFRHGSGPIYHVGIYLKDGKFAHSATNGGVRISSLNQPYYHRNFYAATRVAAVARELTEAEAAE